MTTSPITTAWESLPLDIRRAAEEAAAPLRPMSHAEVLLVVAKAIAGERERCAEYARAYLEDIAGCDMADDEPEQIASGILSGDPPAGGDE
ncbi:hypothetical protein CN157_24230 [Sinorhizobium meliloti]|uniref:hypothetical protein n=1 Tax=Rhizobium meliloti TaxID=382 RepID=UPI0003F721A0|nr:hypothetical protein [Sinorhizobium meliloti]MDE3829560.1 hypothetical protein [Sinorhizobium meliloti]MDE4577649.1 hypothetical protein [Sinorhizobium meliloti]MDW9781041.1 hypothetical protein [Sinorhizobium meliloti]RVK71399.1 hypothetical protein CN157_24230 [Sinorhizobium meliloti]RVL08600.1 hypothetical protein CN149_27475 [Sinorhizobium meliloti]